MKVLCQIAFSVKVFLRLEKSKFKKKKKKKKKKKHGIFNDPYILKQNFVYPKFATSGSFLAHYSELQTQVLDICEIEN